MNDLKKYHKNQIKRTLETDKSEQRLEALHRWKSGEKISFISRELSISRESLYRWIKESSVRLAARRKGSRKIIDELSRVRIIETYILLKRPSIELLRKMLNAHYHMIWSSSQLRRYLKVWGFGSYRPSSFFETIISQRKKP